MRIRRGVTLIEALIAIFLTAIGLLAILTLFPLGAIKMHYAILADRATYAGLKGSSLAEAYDVRRDSNFYSPTAATPIDLFVNALPPPNLPNASFPDLSTISGYDGPGYPIYVDPVGFGSNMFNAVGAYSNPPFASFGLNRQTTSYAGAAPLNYLPTFSLLDDIEFANDGPASGLANNLPTVNRGTRFTWAYLLRRPRYSTPSVTDLSVVLYDKRPILSPSSEITYAPGATPGCLPVTVGVPEIILTYTSATDKPPIKRGGWILDATVYPTATTGPDMQGFFYRVVDVNDIGGNQVSLELEKPIRGGFNQPNLTPNVNRVFVIMEGVIDVIERGSGWKP